MVFVAPLCRCLRAQFFPSVCYCIICDGFVDQTGLVFVFTLPEPAHDWGRYALLLDTYIKDRQERDQLFNAYNNIPCVKQKGDIAEVFKGRMVCFMFPRGGDHVPSGDVCSLANRCCMVLGTASRGEALSCTVVACKLAREGEQCRMKHPAPCPSLCMCGSTLLLPRRMLAVESVA